MLPVIAATAQRTSSPQAFTWVVQLRLAADERASCCAYRAWRATVMRPQVATLAGLATLLLLGRYSVAHYIDSHFRKERCVNERTVYKLCSRWCTRRAAWWRRHVRIPTASGSGRGICRGLGLGLSGNGTTSKRIRLMPVIRVAPSAPGSGRLPWPRPALGGAPRPGPPLAGAAAPPGRGQHFAWPRPGKMALGDSPPQFSLRSNAAHCH